MWGWLILAGFIAVMTSGGPHLGMHGWYQSAYERPNKPQERLGTTLMLIGLGGQIGHWIGWW